MAVISVKNAAGTPEDVEKPNANGRVAAAASRPVTLSDEDFAVLSSIDDSLDDIVTDSTPVTVVTAGNITNPASVLTRLANTTAYTAGDLIANHATAGSITVPSFTAAREAAGSFLMRRFRLYTSKTSGMAAIGVRVRFWTTAPTYTNGDNGVYAVATGSAGYLGKAEYAAWDQFGDGAVAIEDPFVGAEIGVKLASGQLVYWDLEALSDFTPISGQTFTLVPEIHQN
jgi:hypothetical protein